jgi:multimeric flavodoxin WrbA
MLTMTRLHPTLLIAWHSRTGTAEALARAAAEGALGAGDCAVRMIGAAEVTEADMAEADGYLFACPENLATMSGMMKEMVDRLYYPLLGRMEGRPYALIIAAGTDGEGAARQWHRIATGWRLREVADPLFVRSGADTAEAILADKTIEETARFAARDLGTAMAAGLAMGIY